MDFAFLAFSIFFTGYLLFAWKRYLDRESLWLAGLYAFVVLLLMSKLLLLSSLPEGFRGFFAGAIYCSWGLTLALLGVILWKRKG
jgi:hypothetical protein